MNPGGKNNTMKLPALANRLLLDGREDGLGTLPGSHQRCSWIGFGSGSHPHLGFGRFWRATALILLSFLLWLFSKAMSSSRFYYFLTITSLPLHPRCFLTFNRHSISWLCFNPVLSSLKSIRNHFPSPVTLNAF